MIKTLSMTKTLVLLIALTAAVPADADDQNAPDAQKAAWTVAPYRSFDDSPFDGLPFDYFYLEDFEDGRLDTPGAGRSVGTRVIGPQGYPSHLVDSVDGDDGRIDGSGADGHSLWSGNTLITIAFTFDATVLGNLPTHAGLVWTDAIKPGKISLTAFDAAGQTVAKLGPLPLGDAVANGTTAEDHFLGLYHPGGIARLECGNLGGNLEVDHLQYGRQSACRECGSEQLE